MRARKGNLTFPHLDGIRGLAALAILAYHGVGGNYRTITGWVEVATALRSALPLFFFLSAFLLYRPYVAARLGDQQRPALKTFWWRRVLRIVPAYWVALTLIALTVGLPGVFGPQGWRYYAFVYVYNGHTVGGGLEPAWTLCVDMSFYLALPAFALAIDPLWRRLSLRAAVNAELLVLAVIWALSTAYWFAFVSGAPASVSLASLQMREWNLVANLDWFALGMALAVLSATDAHRLSPLTRLLQRPYAVEIAWGAALLTFVIIARTYFFSSETTRHLLASLACVLVFAPAALVGGRERQGRARDAHVAGRETLVGGRESIQRVLAHPAVTWLGAASYGIYLYHGPALNELRELGARIGSDGLLAYLSLLAVTVPIVIALSAASYFLMERPIMRWGRRIGRVTPVPELAASAGSSAGA